MNSKNPYLGSFKIWPKYKMENYRTPHLVVETFVRIHRKNHYYLVHYKTNYELSLDKKIPYNLLYEAYSNLILDVYKIQELYEIDPDNLSKEVVVDENQRSEAERIEELFILKLKI